MHPIRRCQEEASILGDRARLSDQVLQRRGGSALRVRPLRHLGELVRVAEQDQRVRGAAHAADGRQAQLPGFVDEQHVDGGLRIVASPEP
jgi:hypothetical protein